MEVTKPISHTRQLKLSMHAQARCQQRGINLKVLSIVHNFGRCMRIRDGFGYAMDQRRRLRARRDLGETAYKHISDKLYLYMVIATDGETVITVAYRLKKCRA